MDDEEIPNFDFLLEEDLFGDDFVKPENNPSLPDQRFPVSSEDELNTLRRKSENGNTAKSTNTWLNVYRQWARNRNEPEDIEEIPPQQLNLLLERFYAEVKKRDGSDYEPECLGVMQAALDRYLRDKNCTFSITHDSMFTSSRAILSGKATVLREKGKGTRPNASKPLTWEEEEELWKGGKLGNFSPAVLSQTIWYLLTQHLGFRGVQEHKDATVDEFKFFVDEQGNEFVIYEDVKPTKTRKGGIKAKKRVQRPRMFQTGGDQCPVSLFKKYLSHRPVHLRDDGPLFLAINHSAKTDIWYKDQKMGYNRIGQMMKCIVANTSFEGKKRLTNHSGRKTVVKKLDEASVPRSKIISVTGHSNEKSLDDYLDDMNTEQSKQLSRIISCGNG